MTVFLAAGAWVLAAASEAALVRSVRIDAPEPEQRALERYIELRPGQTLDPVLVRRAVELILATETYADVRVETMPVDGGIDVVIRPVPGPLLTEVRVSRDAPIDAGDVREVARLRAREPLWPERLDAAAKAVALHLADQGFPEALVTAEAVQEGRGAASALFQVRSGPRARVTRITVDGLAPSSPSFAVTRPEVGDVWKPPAVREAAEGLRKRLARAGYWRAVVALEDSYDPARGGVAITFRVDRGPILGIDVRGADLPGSLRESVTRLLRDNGARTDAVDEAADRIEESFRRQGHRDARVTAADEVGPGTARIVFTIETGPATTVSSVRMVGDVDAPLVSLLTRVGGALRDRDLDEDARTLVRFLQDNGHAEARVDVEVPDRPGAVAVVFVLRAGPRAEIESVDVATTTPLAEPARELVTRRGRPYRVRDLVADRNTILAAYRNAGYLQVDVTSRPQFSEDRRRVAVRFEVEPGPRTRVAHIVVAGLSYTREEIVRRELRLREGDPLGLAAVLDSQRSLGSLGVFGNVTISEIDPESVETRSLIVRVEELPRTSLAYGIGYSERDGPRLSAEVTRRNLGGQNRSLTTFVRGSFNSLRFFTTYRQPSLFGRRQEFFITGFREEEERETFDFWRFGLILEAARRLTPSWTIIARYATQETQSSNLTVAIEEIDKQYLTATFSGPSLSLVHDSRDDPLDPRRGFFVTADTQLSHRVLGGESFMKGFLQASAYRRLAPQLVLATNGRVGLARTLEGEEPDRLPLPDRFFAGGDYSLRGFKQDRAGPLEPSSVPGAEPVPTGGNALLLAGAELRLGFGRFFGVAAFTEAGQVYPLVDDMDLGDIRYTAGLGVRYKSAFGPIRADWGYKLNRRGTERASHFHLTIGHAF
jgi:outer membrane protein insertion porin family